MTPQPSPFDSGNGLLGEVPAQLALTALDTPAGQRLALTIRTTSATVTVLLNGADAKTWAEKLTAAASGMSGSGLVVAAPGALNGHGQAGPG